MENINSLMERAINCIGKGDLQYIEELKSLYAARESSGVWLATAERLLELSEFTLDEKWKILSHLKDREMFVENIIPVELTRATDGDIGEFIAVDGRALLPGVGTFGGISFNCPKGKVSKEMKLKIAIIHQGWKELDRSVRSKLVEWADVHESDNWQIDRSRPLNAMRISIRSGAKYVGDVLVDTDWDPEHGIRLLFDDKMQIVKVG